MTRSAGSARRTSSMRAPTAVPKPFDLVALTHFHRYGDGTPAVPTARFPVRIERKKTRGMLVTSAGDSQIAQIHKSSVAGLANRRAIDVLQRSEFVGLLQLDAAPACIQRTGGDRGVTLFDRRGDPAWNNAISGDAILRNREAPPALPARPTRVTREPRECLSPLARCVR